MCEAPSTWRARIWLIEPRFFSAEYSGLIAAPGTPNAQVTPSFSRTRTAASIARIFAMGQPRSFVLARGDDHANGARSQRDRFYFPRYGAPPDFSRWFSRLAGRKSGIGVTGSALRWAFIRRIRHHATERNRQLGRHLAHCH